MNARPKVETIRIGERDVPVRDCWATPPWLVDRLHRRWGFGLDAAATKESAIVGPWLGPDHPVEDCRDALATPGPWVDYSRGKPVFCNPPFSQSCGGLTRWVEAFVREGQRCPVVAIVPDTPSTTWFRRAMQTAAEVTMFDRRVQFIAPPGVRSSSPRGGVVVFAWVPRVEGPARVRWDTIPRGGGR